MKVSELFLLMSLIYTASTYNPFEGFLHQGKPCFAEVHVSGCHTTLSKVFSPPYKGSNINAMNTQLWLFTFTNPQKGIPLHKCGGKLPQNYLKLGFDPNVTTIFISHGWLDGMCRTAWMRETKDQLFQRGKYNVILVDWTWGNTIDPAEAAANALVVGEDIGFVAINIMKQTNMRNGDKFHFIGHSYGAYVVNAAGKYVIENEKELKIRRITLLDPAVAPFRYADPRRDLNRENTKFMDVIHGDGGDCFPNNFGIMTPVGHVDFFPNGGTFQVSCYSYVAPTLKKGDFLYGLASLVYPPVCSHLQAIQYFKVSINHPQGLFIGAECNSYQDFMLGNCKRCCRCKDGGYSKCAVMGMDAEKYFPHLHQPGEYRSYYLNLGLECPYNEDYKFSIFRDC